MDLGFYYWHVANHRVPFLWRFHNVHHIDPDLDVSTAFRFHFGEIALSTGFSLLQLSLIGPSAWAFADEERSDRSQYGAGTERDRSVTFDGLRTTT